MKTEIKEKLIKYLTKKDIEKIEINYNSLIIDYEIYYSKFKIKIYFYKKENYYDIKYGSNLYIKNLSKRRTTTKNNNFCNMVLKTINFIKTEMNKEAKKIKDETELKNKYCKELEIHYKNIHDKIQITNISSFDNETHFNINAYDNDSNTWYDIEYKNNKYFLKEKIETFYLKINMKKYKTC